MRRSNAGGRRGRCAGCGAEELPERAAARRRPVELSAKIDDRNVVVVPDTVGAGLAT